MTASNKIAVGRVAAAVVLASACNVAAQQPSPNLPARPVPPAQVRAPSQKDEPQSTTATFADWIVQCEMRNGEPHEICDMAQVTQVQGKNIPFSRVAIAHPEKDQPVRLIVQVPVNVSFQINVRIQTADSDPGFAAPFSTCIPSGCFAQFDLKEDVLKKLRAAAGVGKLSFADSVGHYVTIPLSFRGFGQAFDALVKK